MRHIVSEKLTLQVQEIAMASFVSLWFRRVTSREALAVFAVLSVACVIAQPFGTGAMLGPIGRVVYWPAVVVLTGIVGTAVRVGVEDAAGLRDRWAGMGLVALLNGVLIAPPLWAVTRAVAVGQVPVAPTLPWLTAIVFLVSLAVASLRRVLTSGAGAAIGEPAPAPVARPAGQAPRPPCRLMTRIPEELRGRPVRMEMRGHYVDLFTDRGCTRVLMRFADAMAEADAEVGLRVHRSHWVARAAVTGSRREGRALRLCLSDGVEVPVSRTYEAEVICAGLA